MIIIMKPQATEEQIGTLCDSLGKQGMQVQRNAGVDCTVLGVLGDVAELLSEHPRRSALRQRVFETLVSLGGKPYSTAQLESPEPLAVSYLSTAVENAAGHPAYEIQLGPLDPSVSAADRARYIHELRSAAAKLSQH